MKLINVSKSYDDNIILSNMNLTFDRNGLVFILGQSGSGKSTLLNIIGMLDPKYEGELWIGNKNVSNTKNEYSDYRSKAVAFIFQEYNLISSLTVRENIITSLKLSNTEIDEDRYEKVMHELGILELEDRMVDTLSGGEKQRVAIARAILRESKIILADEPTGNLDEENSEIIMAALKKLSKECLVIVVSHNLQLAEKYADRTIVIRNKQIVEDKDKEYLTNKKADLAIEKQKVKPGLKWYLKLSIRNFLLRRKKLVPIIITMSIALLCIGIILGFYNGVNNMVEGVNKSILDSDLITVYNFNEDGFYDSIIDDTYYNKVVDSVEYSKVLAYYKPVKATIEHENMNIDAQVSIIDYSDFMRSRFEIINGNYIENDNDIIVNESLAEQLFNSKDCIGTKVTISTSTDFYADCIIRGVTDKFDNNHDNRVYVSENLSKQMSIIDVSKEEMMGYIEDDFSYSINYIFKVKDDDQQVIVGQDIDGVNNAVLVNASGLNSIAAAMLPGYSPLSLEDINQGNIPESILNDVLGKEIRLQGLDFVLNQKVTICGICSEKDPSYTLVLYTDSDTINALSQPRVNRINLYLEDYSEKSMNSVIEKYKAEGIDHTVPADQTGFLIMNKMSLITTVMAIIALIFIFLTSQMINLYVRIAVIDRTYEVGVLKSMGAYKKNIFTIFTLDNFILGLVLSLFACILLGLLSIIDINNLINTNSIELYKFSFWLFIPIIFVGCAITVLAGLKETISVSRLSVVDAIRSKGR